MLKICVLWAALAPAYAQVYKWVDEKGTTHYGQKPPQGSKAQEVQQRLANPGTATGTPSQQDWKEKDLEFRSRRIEAEQTETKQKQRDAATRQACNRARDGLAQLKAAQRVYRLNDKGERVYESDEEHRAVIERQERLIAQHCN